MDLLAEIASEIEDGQVKLQGTPAAIEYVLNDTTIVGYPDAAAYNSITKRPGLPALELTAIGELEAAIAEGDDYVSFLYTYRSLIHALGNAKAKSEDTKPMFYYTICQTMKPSIMKMRDLNEYIGRAIKLVEVHAVSLTKPPTSDIAPRELVLEKMMALLDTLLVIDTVKRTKACIMNDFSFYGRQTTALQQRDTAQALTAAGKDPTEFTVDPMTQMKLTEFLNSSFVPPRQGQQATIIGTIKAIPHFETMIVQLLRHAQKQFEVHNYVLPKEKWCLLRIMTLCLCILGWFDDTYPEKTAAKLFQKDIKLDKILDYIREYPAIPLFGDMQMAPSSLLVMSPWFLKMRQEKIPDSVFIRADEAQGKHLEDHIRACRLDEYIHDAHCGVHMTFDKYGATVSKLLRPIESYVQLGRPVPEDMAQEMKTVLMQGIKLVADWSEAVLKFVGYKYARPRQPDVLDVDPAEPSVPYELAVLQNYSSQEKTNLVDMIGYIKGLSSVLKRAEKVVAGVLRMAIHREVQEMVQHVCTDSMLKEDKKQYAKAKIQALQDLVGDWYGGIPPIEEPFHTAKLVLDDGGKGKRAIPRRVSAPTRTQVVLVRSLVTAILAEASAHKSVGTEKDHQLLEDFLHSSFFYGHMLGLSSVADTCADMGDLWYRERYLEVSKQEASNKDLVQFPIKMSLPWILIEHVVKSPNAARIENVLYTLDIYNDAVERALNVLQKQHIFDEVQAELNLCFDQVTFLISERVFVYFKQQAGGILMDKKQRTKQLSRNLEHAAQNPRTRPRGAHHIPTCASSIAKLLAVRNLSLLGRVIDLNSIVTKRVNKMFVKNIESAISRFESMGIPGIKELEMMLNSISLTHSLISKHLQLDSFESMLKEANDDISAVSFHGRIVIHSLSELISEFFPNFVYHSNSRRFKRGVSSEAHEVQPQRRHVRVDAIDQLGGSTLSGTGPSATSRYMSQATKLYSTFVGVEHLEALIRVIGPNNMPLVIYQLMKNLDMKVTNVLGPYVKALAQGFPDRSMPIKDILSLVNNLTSKPGMKAMLIPSVFQIFQIALKDILKYPDMKPEVFQTLRDIGNCFVFMQLLDNASRMSEACSYMQYAPFIGTPSVSKSGTQGSTPLYKTVCAMVDKLNYVWTAQERPPWSSSVTFEDVRRCAMCAEGLANESARQVSTSYFKAAVMLMDKFIDPIRQEVAGGAALPTADPTTLAAQGFIDAEGSLEFHRLYSAILFLTHEVEEDGELPDLEVFGDGLWILNI